MAEPTMQHDQDTIRGLAVNAFNHTWELLDKDDLTKSEQEEMLASTLTQRHLWYQVGEPRNWAIADWQVARVAVVLGYADLSRRFAQKSLELSDEHDLGPFVAGFAHEAIARAAASIDDVDTFTHHLNLARTCLDEITDTEEKDTLGADLAEMSES